VASAGTSPDFGLTRGALHRVGAHILGRRRFDVAGKFGLRASPGGFATPAFGPEIEVLRVSGPFLVREVGGTSTHIDMRGARLSELAAFAVVDLSAPAAFGKEAPPVGDASAPLDVDLQHAQQIATWFSLAWRAIDRVVGRMPPSAGASTIQLWPEHFDAATDVDAGDGNRANLGFSPGDTSEPEPYLYLGPWGSGRPGAPSYWNAPFGAIKRASEIDAPLDSAEALDACVDFLQRGLRALDPHRVG
jgi:hypothetical protein